MFLKSIPVFCYHDVGPLSGQNEAMFREHLDAMQDAGFSTVTAAELVAFMRGEIRLDGRRVVLTFDDGHISSRSVIGPELAKRGMTGCFFVLPGFMDDAPARPLERLPEVRPMRQCFIDAHGNGDFSQFMNTGEVREMLSMGMEIHSHGMRHQPAFRSLGADVPMGNRRAHWGAWAIYPGYDSKWPQCRIGSAYVYDGFWPSVNSGAGLQFRKRRSEDRLAFCHSDFQESLQRVRELNEQREQFFCWPWGQYEEKALQKVKEAGYAAAFSLERWPNAKGGDPFRINRITVGRTKNGKWIQRRLAMYSNRVSATVCFKRYHKKPEPQGILLTSDTTKLSGGSRQMINNAEALNAMGLPVVAMVAPGSPLVDEMARVGADVVEYGGFRKPFSGAAFLKRLVREKGVDTVHTFHNRAYKLGALAKIMGGRFNLFVNRGVISRPNDVFALWTLPARAVICNSMVCADVLRRRHVPEKRLAVVYNAYCGPDLGGPSARKKRGVRFLYIGNSAYIKGFDVFIKAMESFCEQEARDVEFVAVGIRQGELKRLAEGVSPACLERLSLTGIVSHGETLEQVRAADVLVVSSRKESLPNTMLEAFDAGLPVVVTRVGGMPELVRDGVNGFLCESEDAACIADRLRTLMDDRDLRLRMGGINRNIVRSFLTREAKGIRLVQVYMGENFKESLPIEDVVQAVDNESTVMIENADKE